MTQFLSHDGSFEVIAEKCGKVHFNAGRKVVHSFFKDLYHKKWTLNTNEMCNLRKNSNTRNLTEAFLSTFEVLYHID